MKAALRVKLKAMGAPRDALQELERTHNWLPVPLQPLNRLIRRHVEDFRETGNAEVRLNMEVRILRQIRSRLMHVEDRQLIDDFIRMVDSAFEQSRTARESAVAGADIDHRLEERLYEDMRQWLHRKRFDTASIELVWYLERLICAWQGERRKSQ